MRVRILVVLLVLNVALCWGAVHHMSSLAASFNDTRTYVSECLDKERCNETELAVRRIGWVRDVEQGFKIARSTGRPLVIVAGDGAICTGRL